MANTINLTAKENTATLQSSETAYTVTGSTGKDKVSIYAGVNVDTMDLNKGNDEIHLPYLLKEYLATTTGNGILTLKSTDNSYINISLDANGDTLFFKDGSVSVAYSKNTISFNKTVKVANNQFLDLANSKIKLDAKKVSSVVDDDQTIIDDTLPTVSFNKYSSSVKEGNTGESTITFNVTRENNLAKPSSVQYTLKFNGQNSANKDDFSSAISGTIPFEANQDSYDLKIQVSADTTFEADESFSVVLSSPVNAQLGSISSAIGIIENDDKKSTLPQIVFKNNTIEHTEGNSDKSTVNIVLTRDGDLSKTASVEWNLNFDGQNPINADDITGSTSGTATFKAKESTATISVQVKGDTDIENDETFSISLSNPKNGQLVNAKESATVIVKNDDGDVTSTGDDANKSLKDLLAEAKTELKTASTELQKTKTELELLKNSTSQNVLTPEAQTVLVSLLKKLIDKVDALPSFALAPVQEAKELSTSIDNSNFAFVDLNFYTPSYLGTNLVSTLNSNQSILNNMDKNFLSC